MRTADDFTVILQRIKGEYWEMPGLKLTVAQAARLWAVEAPEVEHLLDMLVTDGLLRRTPTGAYLVRSEYRAH